MLLNKYEKKFAVKFACFGKMVLVKKERKKRSKIDEKQSQNGFPS
jgi:hypothetical protein